MERAIAVGTGNGEGERGFGEVGMGREGAEGGGDGVCGGEFAALTENLRQRDEEPSRSWWCDAQPRSLISWN